ncbi:hypothetical protein ABIB62_000977 [Mucilaginibacter sp. UYP25]
MMKPFIAGTGKEKTRQERIRDSRSLQQPAAFTKLASQENSKGYINPMIGSEPLTVSLLAAPVFFKPCNALVCFYLS